MTTHTEELPSLVLDKIGESFDEGVAARILEGFHAANERPVTLRVNTLKADAGRIGRALEAAGIAFERVSWYPDAFVLEGVRERHVWPLDIYGNGEVYLQSLSSMLPPLALDPRAGADILDMCAAPGGKTSQMAALACGEARITACELSAPRAAKLEHNLDKLGVRGVQVLRTDARRLDEFFSFDQVLLDAPCTGTGTLRADDARAHDRITRKLLERTTRAQRALIDRGLTVLKPGGRLVYSTCSILPDENEEIVAAALRRHRDCEIKPLRGDWVDDTPALPCRIEGALTVMPTRLHEGFFVALIEKAR
ncbi:MAG: RsmB/NOP family class I SAM-dependent RNA methyltransferase [Collinsella sp.]|nr:RsmB/NOP family class I SAM-dependent RNA methyltransferase [Collinsella sp.]